MTSRIPQMTRSLLLSVLLIPAAAAAQTATPARGDDQKAGVETVRLTLTADPGALELTQAPSAQPQAPPPDRRRRRPSMVGYINDAGVQSQIRIRFDAGTGITAADRAEFFYAKCGCFRFIRPESVIGGAFDPDARGPGPGIATELNFQQLYLQAEAAVGSRFSVYGELPVRWLQPQSFAPTPASIFTNTGTFGDQSGLSDVRAGVKLALVATDESYLTVQLQGNFPTGDGFKGLGNEHFSFEPALLYNQALGDRVNFEGQFGVVLPADGSDGIPPSTDKFSGKVVYYGIGPSVEVYSSYNLRFAPVLEIVGWRVLDGFQTNPPPGGPAEGVNIVNLKVGGRFVMRDRSSIYIGYGKALTDDVWYDDLFRFEYRFSF